MNIKVTIDLKRKFTGLNGLPFTTGQGAELAPANEIIAGFLYNNFSPDKSDKLRNRTWAEDLYKTGKLELDKKSIDVIVNVAGNSGMLDGLFCQFNDWMEEYKAEWDRLREEEKNRPKDAQG